MNLKDFDDILKTIALAAFQAGIKRGKDCCHGGVLKYDHEITEPCFDVWWQKAMARVDEEEKTNDN